MNSKFFDLIGSRLIFNSCFYLQWWRQLLQSLSMCSPLYDYAGARFFIRFAFSFILLVKYGYLIRFSLQWWRQLIQPSSMRSQLYDLAGARFDPICLFLLFCYWCMYTNFVSVCHDGDNYYSRCGRVPRPTTWQAKDLVHAWLMHYTVLDWTATMCHGTYSLFFDIILKFTLNYRMR